MYCGTLCEGHVILNCTGEWCSNGDDRTVLQAGLYLGHVRGCTLDMFPSNATSPSGFCDTRPIITWTWSLVHSVNSQSRSILNTHEPVQPQSGLLDEVAEASNRDQTFAINVGRAKHSGDVRCQLWSTHESHT